MVDGNLIAKICPFGSYSLVGWSMGFPTKGKLLLLALK